MGLKSLLGGGSLLIDTRMGFPCPNTTGGSGNSIVMNAINESIGGIGFITLEGGEGSGPKTISAAGGGKIHWVDGGSVLDDPASIFRIGIQEVGATGIENGIWDVYGETVSVPEEGGTRTTVMTNGSKTINHRDMIACVFKMQAYGGGDFVNQQTLSIFKMVPYRTQNTGSGVVKVATGPPVFAIEFDDGTLGWFTSIYPAFQVGQSFSAGSTPDEFGLIFRLPISCEIGSVYFTATSWNTSDPLDIVIYEDPFNTTPVVLRTVPVNPLKAVSSGVNGTFPVPILPLKISANKYYCITTKLAGAGFITFIRYDFGVGNSYLRRATLLGENWGYGSRTNGVGAFAYNQERLPAMGFEITKLNSGAFTAPISN